METPRKEQSLMFKDVCDVHVGQQRTYFCLDKKCKFDSRFACPECFLKKGTHFQHQDYELLKDI